MSPASPPRPKAENDIWPAWPRPRPPIKARRKEEEEANRPQMSSGLSRKRSPFHLRKPCVYLSADNNSSEGDKCCDMRGVNEYLRTSISICKAKLDSARTKGVSIRLVTT